VDVLFDSAANCKLRGAIAVILTGMGSDGADGVASLKAACPSWCIAQDAATSTVYGMPQAVAQRDLHDEILPLQEIGPRINKLFRL
jgi:two-component system chemotaxis response regulator CheB